LIMFKHFSRSLIVAAAALAATFSAGTAQAEWDRVISSGHVDLNGFLVNESAGELGINLRTTGDVFSDPSETLIQILESVTRPDAFPTNLPEFDFLGVGVGETLWVSPVSVSSGAFSGANVPELGTRNSWRPDAGGVEMFFEFDMSTFSGPGRMSVFTSDADLRVSSESSLNAPNYISELSHTHYNWAFTEAGFYSVDVRVTGSNNNGSFASGWTTLNFQAGPAGNGSPTDPEFIPEPSSLALVGLGAGIFGVALRRRARRRQADEA
jgi:surface-anchored protein